MKQMVGYCRVVLSPNKATAPQSHLFGPATWAGTGAPPDRLHLDRHRHHQHHYIVRQSPFQVTHGFWIEIWTPWQITLWPPSSFSSSTASVSSISFVDLAQKHQDIQTRASLMKGLCCRLIAWGPLLNLSDAFKVTTVGGGFVCFHSGAGWTDIPFVTRAFAFFYVGVQTLNV